jgi:hypothetical protein
MICFICQAPTRYYFDKKFNRFGLSTVTYQRCRDCGTVYAETLLELSQQQWQAVCDAYHGSYRGSGKNPDDPNWRTRLEAQAKVLLQLTDSGLLSNNKPWLDYGCGEGELAEFLRAGVKQVACYDRYWQGSDYLQLSDLSPGHFSMVISTSTLEHLRSRSEMDELARLVARDGCLGLHTLVRGEIPCDPDWFYLLPVHTIFYTNQGMAYLFEQWGFQSSLYAVDARLWVWFRKRLELLPEEGPGLITSKGWYYSDGFTAYWP